MGRVEIESRSPANNHSASDHAAELFSAHLAVTAVNLRATIYIQYEDIPNEKYRG